MRSTTHLVRGSGAVDGGHVVPTFITKIRQARMAVYGPRKTSWGSISDFIWCVHCVTAGRSVLLLSGRTDAANCFGCFLGPIIEIQLDQLLRNGPAKHARSGPPIPLALKPEIGPGSVLLSLKAGSARLRQFGEDLFEAGILVNYSPPSIYHPVRCQEDGKTDG
jgi:hypothetical protein